MSNFLRTVPLFLSALFLMCAHAVRANELERLFQDSVVFTNVGYASGSTVISNFPLRVDVSTIRPYGFDYTLANNMAGDVRFNYHEEFIQDSTNAVIDTTCYFSVSNWNPNGVSTIYVKVPRFSDNPTAKLTMYWNPVAYAELPQNMSIMVPAAITNSEESVEWNKAIRDQAANPNYLAHGPAYRRIKRSATEWETKLLDYWLTEPTISKSTWKQGEPGAVVTIGKAGSLSETSIRYVDRNTNAELGMIQPLTPGAYYAVVSTAESSLYAPLEKRLGFTISGGVDAGGTASTNDFEYSATYTLTGAEIDLSQAAGFVSTSAKKSLVRNDYTYESDITDEVTIGIWFKMDADAAAAANQGDKTQLISLCGARQLGPLCLEVDNYTKDRRKTIRASGHIGTTPANAKIETSLSSRVDDGKWHFMMATRGRLNRTFKLYFDGRLVKEQTFDGSQYEVFFCEGGNKLSIGCDAYNNDWDRGFNGWLAEAQLYNRVLSADEIGALYADGNPVRLTGYENGLIAYFPLNEVTTPGERTGGVFFDKNHNIGTHNATIGGPINWTSATLPFVSRDSDMGKYPVLIQLSEGVPVGFSYDTIAPDKMKSTLTVQDFYREVRFFDESGNPLNYEVETFNPNGGTSLIWVDTYRVDSRTKIVMCWGQFAYTQMPDNDPSSVWLNLESGKDRIRDVYLANYGVLINTGTMGQNPGHRLQNRWIEEPWMDFYSWLPGAEVPGVHLGTTFGGAPSVRYYDRNTGATFTELPVDQIGEYRAIFRFEETRRWSSLELTRDFRIVREQGNHNPGSISTRMLLANSDYSVDRGEVDGQSYDDNEDGWGVPYWTHHNADSTADVSDFDSTKLFADYNLFAGTHHEYMSVAGERIWGLVNVRFGNIFNNGKSHPGERGNDGLIGDRNYLPWNPDSQRMLSYQGMTVGEFHRYAGTFVMQNVCNDSLKQYAEICSPCYDDGIGTIYFDIVNAFTNNIYDADGNPNYAIVVEIATNMVDAFGMPLDGPPLDAEYPFGIWSIVPDPSLCDYYRYADWKPVTMHPVRFHGNSGNASADCTVMPETTRLVLDVADGGTCCNFYRVYAPVDIDGQVRFRIRRVAIDGDASLNPDAEAFILVDNVICSKSRERFDFKPYGHFDETRGGKQLLGQEQAFTPSFPGISDAVLPRVRAIDKNGNDVPPGYVTAVSMHYRWTYLNQARTDWMIADLSPMTLDSTSPLMLPEGLPGDIEFWFEGAVNADYYCYANYSGTKVALPWYTESCSLATNGWNGARSKAGWSVRIREGRSEYEEGVLLFKDSRGRIQELQMALTGDHTWRGYLQTTNAIPSGLGFRVEFRNYEPNGSKVWDANTNRYCFASDVPDPFEPFSDRMVPCSEDGWAKVPVDAYTGYLMFQADETSKALSVVRADYQNFNKWTDGLSGVTNVVFIGTAGDDSALPKSGVSPKSKDYFIDYTTNLTVCTHTNAYGLWSCNFDSVPVDPYIMFAAGEQTAGTWRLGKGQFVYGLYQETKSKYALQMAGCGEGYAEFSDQSLGSWPRGVQKVTFSARLAQGIDFDDFTYYEGAFDKKDYCFSACGAFDNDSNRSFTGNASLSLIGYYRRGKGCYEMRWEQILGELDTAGVPQGPYKQGQRLAIYRWTRNSGGGYDSTLLTCITNNWYYYSTSQGKWTPQNSAGQGWNFDMPLFAAGTSVAAGKFLPMRLSIYEKGDGNMIVASVFSDANGSTALTPTTDKWRHIAYYDCDASRPKSGTYGILTANSPGMFKNLEVGNIPDDAKDPGDTGAHFWGTSAKYLKLPAANKGSKATNNNNAKVDLAFPSIAFDSCQPSINNELWAEIPGRNEHTDYGFKATTVGQTISVLAAKDYGDAVYDTQLAAFSITNCWGTIKSTDWFGNDTFIWRPEDAKLRFKVGGKLKGICTDVVIDNIEVYQWRGLNSVLLYENTVSADNPIDVPRKSYAAPADFVYTSGWVNKPVDGKTAIELCAKKTIPGRPAGVRTPLMDGVDGRGSGLGNIEISYRNCQPNTVLLVQVATNVMVGSLAALTRNCETNSASGSWMTIARLEYDRLQGTGSINIPVAARIPGNGYGAVGRVILDPALVDAASSMDNEHEFGSIEITKVVCQDEPPIDKGCWWGWNLRTVGDANDSERRMYLPDASERPGVGYSFALNNSVVEDIDQSRKSNYPRHMPFLQSPTFTNNVIGEVSFRARKYSTSEYDQYAEVAVYGIRRENIVSGLDENWELLTRFVVSNTVFTAYNYRATDEGKYAAIRLGVTGVYGVTPTSRGPSPKSGDTPVKVLLDEVTVCEAIQPQLAFRNVGAFRTDLSGQNEVPNVPSRSEQPLCEEAWGIQCELYSVMLDDQIDKRNPPAVKLWWYEGTDKWGYKNWKSDPNVHSGWLARAADSEALIYRSSYLTAPDAVIPSAKKEFDPIVVQYMLEVHYAVINPSTGLAESRVKFVDVRNEWKVPEWYAPLDYNSDRIYNTDGDSLACFCILDELAPGWAWINEVNIFAMNSNGDRDDNCQFVEIAAPKDIDMLGWRIDMLEGQEESDMIVTNTIAIFGANGLPTKKSVNTISNYVFHVVGCPDQRNGHDRSIFSRPGALDATWKFTNYRNSDAFDVNGAVQGLTPIGIRLIRPNGIVEHEIVTVGTNIYTSVWGRIYSPDGVVDYLNRKMSPSSFFFPGEDSSAGDHSVGVVNSRGEMMTGNWNTTMKRTPGEINEGQQINPDYPLPMGDMVYIFAEVDQSGGKIEQSFDGGLSFTNEAVRTFVRKGSTVGTNVIYKVEPWYEVEYAKQVDGTIVKYLDVSNGFHQIERTVEVTIGKGCSNRVTVTAKACPDHQLRDLGCDEKNIYTPAVINWLQGGRTLRGDFANSDNILRLAEFWDFNGYVGPLTLTEMYWLDIDPTAGQMVLQADMYESPHPVIAYEGENTITNDRMTVFMMITNRANGDAWSPYVLRGAQPGELSTAYQPGTGYAWTSETFKIRGCLLNGHTSESISSNWVDLRYFVFRPDSFYQIADEAAGHHRFTTDIEIIDPVNSKRSPGYGAGWYDWVRKNGSDVRPVYKWGLDTRLRPFGVESMGTNNYYKVTAP